MVPRIFNIKITVFVSFISPDLRKYCPLPLDNLFCLDNYSMAILFFKHRLKNIRTLISSVNFFDSIQMMTQYSSLISMYLSAMKCFFIFRNTIISHSHMEHLLKYCWMVWRNFILTSDNVSMKLERKNKFFRLQSKNGL